MLYDAIVIGAGITGLTAAYHLQQAGFSVKVIERRAHVGGVIQSCREEGYLTESGPNTFQSTGKAIMQLCGALGLSPQAAAHQAKKRYLYHLSSGGLHPLPMSPLALLQTPLLSGKGKCRILLEPFISTRLKPVPPWKPQHLHEQMRYISRAPERTLKGGGETPDESVADFIRRRLGDEVLTQFVGPFLSGVYAGDPEHLSLSAVFPKLAQWEQETGSLLKGALSAAFTAQKNKKSEHPKGPRESYHLYNFPQGMRTLPLTLAAKLPDTALQLGITAENISRETFESRLCYTMTLSNGETLRSRALLPTMPAFACAELLKHIVPEIQPDFLAIPYAPIAIVHFGYAHNPFPHPLDGFGCLVPRNAGIGMLGCLWISSLFPDRAPDGHILLTCFIGGAQQPSMALSVPVETLVEQAKEDLSRIFKVSPIPKPDYIKVTTHTQAIPQYTLGHLERIRRIRQATGSVSGLSIAGNYLSGVSLNDCIACGVTAAETLIPYLSYRNE